MEVKNIVEEEVDAGYSVGIVALIKKIIELVRKLLGIETL